MSLSNLRRRIEALEAAPSAQKPLVIVGGLPEGWEASAPVAATAATSGPITQAMALRHFSAGEDRRNSSAGPPDPSASNS
jgi:hypothetical protein